jgi:hypothetical protein
MGMRFAHDSHKKIDPASYSAHRMGKAKSSFMIRWPAPLGGVGAGDTQAASKNARRFIVMLIF